jgi:hypothetical protein
MPQVPAVADLHCVRQGLPDGLTVGPRPVTAHDLDSRVVPQPLFGNIGGAALEDVDAPAGPGVDEHGCVDAAAAQREVVDPQDPRHRQGGKRDPEKDPQCGVPGDGDAQRRQQPRRGPAPNSRATALTCPASRAVRRW